MASSRAELERRIAELEAQNRELIEMNRRASQWLRGTVHQLRTPITNLVLRVYLAERARSERQADYLPEFKQHIARLKAVTDDLADFAHRDWRSLDERPPANV